MVLRRMEADVSCGTLLLSHPKTRASLSVRRVTSLPMRMLGQHIKGSSRPTASRVEDLQPKAWSLESLFSRRNFLGNCKYAKNQIESSSMVLMDAAPLSP